MEDADQVELAQAVRELAPAVIVTGGHTDGGGDVLIDHQGSRSDVPNNHLPGGAAHGSGCTHSSALAARLARGDSLFEAACHAHRVAADAVAQALGEIGEGTGPVDPIGLPFMRDLPRWA